MDRIASPTQPVKGFDAGTYHYGHGLWVDDVYLVAVSTPDVPVGDDDHAADGVVGAPQVQQVVALHVPLAIYTGKQSYTLYCWLDVTF